MTDTKLFAGPGDGEWTDLGNGNRRRVILHNEALMTVEFTFEKGGIGALHSHPHVQASYIAEGLFEVTIDGKTETLGAGGSFIVPPNTVQRSSSRSPSTSHRTFSASGPT